MSDLEQLTPKQQKAIAALLAGQTMEAAAQAASVNATTIYRWLDDPIFKAAHDTGRRQLAELAMSKLQGLADTAVDVVSSLMQEGNPPAIRLRAAMAILDNNTKWFELQDIVKRIEALEQGKYEQDTSKAD